MDSFTRVKDRRCRGCVHDAKCGGVYKEYADRADRLTDRFQQRYEEEWDNPEVSFQYALALMATLQSIRSGVDGHRTYSVAMETLGDVLSAAPDNWLARYSRARLRALVPTAFTVYKMFVEHERNLANDDLRDLAERQSGVAWQPYFACAHLQLAFLASQAEDWPTVHRQIELAGAQPPAPVGLPALGTMLCEPFLAVHGVVEAGHRAAVGDLMATMFPEQEIVTTALHQPTGAGQSRGSGQWRS
jgi:hypothetical protein